MSAAPTSGARASRLRQRDLLTPAVLADPYPLYAQLRAGATLVSSTGWQRLARHADVELVLRDGRFSVAAVRAALDRGILARLPEADRRSLAGGLAIRAGMMLYTDRPRHTRLRRLVQATFTPAATARLRARVQELVADLLDRARRRGRLEVVGDLGYPLPAMVIADLLGLPPEDHAHVKRISDAVIRTMGTGAPDPASYALAHQALEELTAYLAPFVAERRRRPRDDFLSALVRAESRGQIDEAELHATVLSVLVGGHETTTGLIANGLLALLRHPDQLELLRERRAPIGAAVEELLRFDSPIQLTARVATADVELNGRGIRRGQLLECWLGAASRDPARFPDPDRLDVRRSPNHHVAFGLGPHFCLGAALARLEGSVALDAVLQAFPRLRLASRPVEWQPSVVFRCPAELHVEI